MQHRFLTALILALLFSLATNVRAQEQSQTQPQTQQPSKFDQAVKDLKRRDNEGGEMWTMYHDDDKLLVELDASDLNQEYIVLTSIARGVGSGMVISGMSWGFGDDVIWTFRKSGDKIYVLRRNVRFTADKNSPEATAVDLAYSDSVLYALPIITKSPKGADLVDMTRIFMSDDQQIGPAIGPGFRFASDRSRWSKVSSFPGNAQLEVAAVYSGSGNLEKVPDPRGVQVTVHYSISTLPKIGSYKPRRADDRVGYFLTTIKDYSNREDGEHFIRYVNRWDLQKKNPELELSPPKTPIIFHIEKTLPVFLRPTVEAAILEWNKAYEKIGFAGAIRVEHEEDLEAKYGIDIDPEDVRYNFFRWITSDAGFAMGPSRVDPRTGQILDADIIFDAGFLDSWKQRYESITTEDAMRLMPNYSPLQAAGESLSEDQQRLLAAQCLYGQEMQQHLAFANAVLMGHGEIAASDALPMELVQQGIKEVVMHEVGHTLGLRHNFKASTWKSLDATDDTKDPHVATVASVMDYTPANISPDRDKQGLYYSQTIGPYDYWVIEYGYKPIKGSEGEELAKIAARVGQEGLDYATDEDTESSDPDPLTNRFDLGKDPLAFVRRQMEHAESLIPEVVERTTEDGDGYQRARQAFGLLFREYWRSAQFAARFPGGVYVNRDHKGENSRPPFEIVEAEKQREAMKLLVNSALAAPDYDGKLLNYLASTRWNHWGLNESDRVDYPIHESVEQMQAQIVSQLLSSRTLERMLDNEYKTRGEDDAYTLAEHLRLFVNGVFSEWSKEDAEGEFTDRKPYIVSFRRNLQRDALRRLGGMVTSTSAPSDARTLARMHLGALAENIEQTLGSDKLKLDDYSRAHLEDSRHRIQQVLEAEVTVSGVN